MIFSVKLQFEFNYTFSLEHDFLYFRPQMANGIHASAKWQSRSLQKIHGLKLHVPTSAPQQFFPFIFNKT